MLTRISIFGKSSCGKCKATRDKVNHLVDRLGLAGQVEVCHYDMDSEEGIAEGAFRDVRDVPTTIIEADGSDQMRWSGVIPDSEELQRALRPQ